MRDGTAPLVDIHCHQYRELGLIQLLSRDVHEVGFSLAEQLSSQTCAPTHDDLMPDAGYFSLGIHPWYIERQDIDYAFQCLEAVKSHPKLLAIGECGLDKCIELSMARQIDIFTRQIELAERSEKPLIIHCVRSYSEIQQLKKQLRPKQPWIIHGFNGKPALAAQLIKQGCYLSFGAALFRSDRHAAHTLQSVPANRIFLETDTDARPISQIYAAAARIRSAEFAQLRQQIFTNFLNVFHHD